MSAILPFEAFLELLRSRGYAVGLHEHFAVAKLLAQWDRTDADTLGDAIAALIGRTEDEVVAIRDLFDELRAPPAAVTPSLAAAPVVPQRRLQPWMVAAVAGALLIALLVWQRPWLSEAPPETQRAEQPEPPPADAAAVVEVPPPTPPLPPEPPSTMVRATLYQASLAVFLVALAWCWRMKAGALNRRWLREAWRATLGALPGPYHYGVRLRGLTTRLPRIDVEDAAVVLGRIFSAEARARQLDVKATLMATVKRGMLPHFVFKRARTARPIVVLQDVGFEMTPWHDKVESLLRDLARQGVALERWYFEGDLRRVTDKPRSAWIPLSVALNRRADFPLVVLSTGSGLNASLEDGDDTWRSAIQQCPHRVWITPLVDARLWPDALMRVPIPVWPMTRRGLTQAARELAGIEGSMAVRARVLEEGHVTADQIERVKRLASLVPHPTTDLLEFLRQRFAPDVPDAVIGYLMNEADAPGARVIRLDDEELRRCVAAVRLETPRLEAAVRTQLLTVLHDSEPPADSAAHLRWQLAVAMQELSLSQLRDEEASKPLQTLSDLAQGPLWEEVRAATDRMPISPSGPHRPVGTPRVQEGMPPAENDQLSVHKPRPRVWPGVREAVTAAAAAAVLVAVASLVGVFPTATLAHVENAYELSVVDPNGQPRLEVRRTDATQPASVNLYQDSTLFASNVATDGTAAIDVSGGRGRYYQAWTSLPGGNLAMSNPVWVPADNLIVVLIDARPWARVTVEGTGVSLAPQPTPVRVALRPGTYSLTLENGGVTNPLSQPITVVPGNASQRFTFTMPGFDAERAVTDVLGR